MPITFTQTIMRNSFANLAYLHRPQHKWGANLARTKFFKEVLAH
jgi:hypothetical protein